MFQSTSDLVERIGSSYVLALMAAKRAKQLKEGAPPLVDSDSNHSLTIALAEIAQNKVRPILEVKTEEVEQEPTPEETLLALEATVALPALDIEEETLAATADIRSLLEEDEETEEAVSDEEAADMSVLLNDEEAVDSEDEDEEPLIEIDPDDLPGDVVIEDDADSSDEETPLDATEEPLD
jgi:DNA-directed RNA polymerase subunit omega